MAITDDKGALAWIESGQRFSFQDIVFWRGKDKRSFVQAARTIDTIVLGPHATAAFPRELEPFVSPSLTRRKQFDYSDVCTSALGRAWAEADDRVAFVENPHPRLVSDANRAPPESIELQLREFYHRLREAGSGRADFTGVDAVRPLTFAGEPVLIEPADDAAFSRLAEVLNTCTKYGVREYVRVRERLVDMVTAIRNNRGPLLVVSLHDTSNLKAQADGAIRVNRPTAEQMPWGINLGNRGDTTGAKYGNEDVTFDTHEFRRLARACAVSFDYPPDDEEGKYVSLNKPYKGAHETTYFGNKLRRMGSPRIGAVQLEINRRLLLGKGLHHLMQPGVGWPAVDHEVINAVARDLADAVEIWRDNNEDS